MFLHESVEGRIGRIYRLDRDVMKIGRRSDQDVVLRNLSVPRQHSEILHENGSYRIVRVSTRVPLLVNGAECQEKPLADGDEITVGELTLVFRSRMPAEEMADTSVDTRFPLEDPDSGELSEPAEARGYWRLASIYDLCHEMKGLTTEEEVLTAFLDELRNRLRPPTLCLHLVRGARLQAVLGSWSKTSVVRPDDDPLLAEVLRTKEGRTGRLTGTHGNPTVYFLCCPLISGDSSVGVVLLERSPPAAAFTQEDVEYIAAAGRIISTCAENLRLKQWDMPAENALGATPSRGFLCRDPLSKGLLAEARRIAKTDRNVLITGETGTGKEVLARMIHSWSGRADRVFYAVNCSAIPEHLLESELFGVKRGSFTGAEERQGAFEEARGGTLFLDEIGDLPLALQAKVLRAVETKEIQPVGGKPVRVDVRIVEATNRDLVRRMQEGQFREDLFYRLADFHLEIPPLRDRPDDITFLFEELYRAHENDAARPEEILTQEARDLLHEYSWPGNVRELEKLVFRVFLKTGGSRVTATHVKTAIGNSSDVVATTGSTRNVPTVLYPMAEVERRYLRQVLDAVGWNKTKAARILGISRPTLIDKVKRYGLRPTSESMA